MIEWNGRLLQGKTYQEVADIIAESKQEANVELIVSRSMGSRRAAQANWRHSAANRGTRFFVRYIDSFYFSSIKMYIKYLN